MGRQVHFHMLPEDRDFFFASVCKDQPIIVTEMVGSSPEVIPAKLTEGSQWLCLWNKNFLPQLKRNRIPNAEHEPFRIDETELPVLEFSSSFGATWEGRPALVQGRVYGKFENKTSEFEKWYETIVRWIRKNFARNPTSIGGYIGPAAYAFYQKGGYLLPNFVPPKTRDWVKELGKQHGHTK